ncbi:MAG: GDSL-type esterase/lipase family protein [Bdellovibrionota bacterium]
MLEKPLQSRAVRGAVLLAAGLLGFLLLEGLARLLEPGEKYFHARLFQKLPAADAARLNALLASESAKFEATYRLGASQVLDTENFVIDPTLVYRLAPSLSQKSLNFTLRPEIREEERWTYNANAEGWRGLIPSPKEPGELRIVTLGDSTTYGWGLEEEESWPARLAKELGNPWGVFNRAVPGYTSYQGSLLSTEANSLSADMVTIGYGANDAMPYPLREEEIAKRISIPLAGVAGRLALPRLLARLFFRMFPKPEPTNRVPPEEYEKRLGEISKHVREKSEPLLLSLCVSDPRYEEALGRVSKTEGIPLLRFEAGEEPTWIEPGGTAKCSAAEVLEQAGKSASAPSALEKTRHLAGDERKSFFADDCHPTPWGALVIAKSIACRIESLRRSL